VKHISLVEKRLFMRLKRNCNSNSINTTDDITSVVYKNRRYICNEKIKKINLKICGLLFRNHLFSLHTLSLSNRNVGKLIYATFTKWKRFIASIAITYFIMVIRIIFSIEVSTLNQLSKYIVQQDSRCSTG